MVDLTGVRAKIEHGARHAEAFRRAWEAYIDESPYTLEPEEEAENVVAFRWRVSTPLPAQDLALVFSDAVTNLRGALDHLVCELVRERGGKANQQTAFPVVLKEATWPRAEKTRLGGVAVDAVERIRALQPFHLPDPQEHPLAQLSTAANLCKHRRVPHPAVLPHPVVELDAWRRPDHRYEVQFFPGQIQDGAVYGRVRNLDKEPLQIVRVAPKGLRIVLRDDSNYIWTLSKVVPWVREMVDGFDTASGA